MKKAILTLLMIPAFVGMLFSCSEVKTDAKKLEGKWNIVEVKGEKILKEGLPNMEFDMKDNKVHGNAGCNIFNSTVVLDDQDISSITIDRIPGNGVQCIHIVRIHLQAMRKTLIGLLIAQQSLIRLPDCRHCSIIG